MTVEVHLNPFDEDGVMGMMSDVEKARDVIERNARLIDKEELDSGLQSLNQGKNMVPNSGTAANHSTHRTAESQR
jgi:hypothetical protein